MASRVAVSQGKKAPSVLPKPTITILIQTLLISNFSILEHKNILITILVNDRSRLKRLITTDNSKRINMASAKSEKNKQIKEQSIDFSSDNIENQIAAFLASGGKIQQIPLGVSGQVATSGPRHITLGKRHTN